MNTNLEREILNLNFENKTILDLSRELKSNFTLTEISNALCKIRIDRGDIEKNRFGRCGIDPNANPCGDASEY